MDNDGHSIRQAYNVFVDELLCHSWHKLRKLTAASITDSGCHALCSKVTSPTMQQGDVILLITDLTL
jgi:hypothetical protein